MRGGLLFPFPAGPRIGLSLKRTRQPEPGRKATSSRRCRHLCEAFAADGNRAEVTGSAKIARALAHLHAGEGELAIALMTEGEKYLRDENALAIRKSIRAFLASTCGLYSLAETLLDELDNCPYARGLVLRETCIDLARATLDMARRPREDVREVVDRLIRTFQDLSHSAALVYAFELSADLSARTGDRARSRSDLARAVAIRRELGMPHTQWDKMRLLRISA